jgi:hypothetical protein
VNAPIALRGGGVIAFVGWNGTENRRGTLLIPMTSIPSLRRVGPIEGFVGRAASVGSPLGSGDSNHLMRLENEGSVWLFSCSDLLRWEIGGILVVDDGDSVVVRCISR